MSAEMPDAPETTRESLTRLTPSFTAVSVNQIAIPVQMAGVVRAS